MNFAHWYFHYQISQLDIKRKQQQQQQQQNSTAYSYSDPFGEEMRRLIQYYEVDLNSNQCSFTLSFQEALP